MYEIQNIQHDDVLKKINRIVDDNNIISSYMIKLTKGNQFEETE